MYHILLYNGVCVRLIMRIDFKRNFSACMRCKIPWDSKTTQKLTYTLQWVIVSVLVHK